MTDQEVTEHALAFSPTQADRWSGECSCGHFAYESSRQATITVAHGVHVVRRGDWDTIEEALTHVDDDHAGLRTRAFASFGRLLRGAG